MERLTYSQEGGPLFIFLGGEWSITGREFALADGPLSRFAEEHKGALFAVEHRFYGESFPFDNTSVESFNYLSLDQVLADFANFIKFIKSSNPAFANSKVIVVGGSYSAALASWMRLKYPHLVDGAWASSPANENVMNFPGQINSCLCSFYNFKK